MSDRFMLPGYHVLELSSLDWLQPNGCVTVVYPRFFSRSGQQLLTIIATLTVHSYMRVLCTFPFETISLRDEAVACLQLALIACLKKYPFLAGQVSLNSRRSNLEVNWQTTDRFEKHLLTPVYLGRDVFSCSYADLCNEGMPSSKLPADLLSPVPDQPTKESAPVLRIQANFISGGLLLCICCHSSVADGPGFTQVIKSFAYAMMHRDLLMQGRDLKVEEGGASTRQKLSAGVAYLSNPALSCPELQLIDYDLDWASRKTSSDPASRKIEARIFSIPLSRLKALKYAVLEYNFYQVSTAFRLTTPKIDRLSTHFLLTALLWVHVTRARWQATHGFINFENPRTATLLFPVNIRSRLDSTIPASFIGNATIFAHATIPLRTLLRSASMTSTTQAELIPILCAIISALQNAALQINDSYVRTRISFANSLTSPASFRPALALTSPGFDLVVSNWDANDVARNLVATRSDFKIPGIYRRTNAGYASGCLDYVRRVSREPEAGCVFIMPRRRRVPKMESRKEDNICGRSSATAFEVQQATGGAREGYSMDDMRVCEGWSGDSVDESDFMEQIRDGTRISKKRTFEGSFEEQTYRATHSESFTSQSMNRDQISGTHCTSEESANQEDMDEEFLDVQMQLEEQVLQSLCLDESWMWFVERVAV